jgi:hypothetical protein
MSQMRPLLAWSISLNSTFKTINLKRFFDGCMEHLKNRPIWCFLTLKSARKDVRLDMTLSHCRALEIWRGINYAGGKIATDIKYTDGKFATVVSNTGSK